MVDVVDLDADLPTWGVHHGLAGVEFHEVLDGRDDVVDRQDALLQVEVEAELLVDLVATDFGQVVTLLVEVQVLKQVERCLLRRRLAWTQFAVNIKQCLILGRGVVFLQSGAHRLILAKLLENACVIPAQGLEEDGDRLFALPVDSDSDQVLLVDFKFQPSATAWDQLGRPDVLIGGLIHLEVDARRTDQLRYNNALSSVDDESAAVGHQWEVTHEDRLALNFTGDVVGELSRQEQRRAVCDVALFAVVD
ncbi:hypothetical protein GALL_425470 [mine drainage metagenome]|uniref:Uncharacterized protein n=1 Tax=mine drainage metagenome TaxID=410659 RepID=A0A1J5PWC0_9ZZZZ